MEKREGLNLEKSDDLSANGKQSILLVDDDEVTLEIMKIYLKKFYTVTGVSRGALALEVLSKQPIDLVLLDYMMPEMDGPTVFQHIRDDFPELNVPIIFLTGLVDQDLVIQGLKLQPVDYLLKPVKQADLLERVRAVLLKS